MLKKLFEKMLSYILSIRRDGLAVTRMKAKLAKLHKMQSDNQLEIACLACEIALKARKEEPRVMDRINHKLEVRSDNSTELLEALMRLSRSVITTDASRKYINLPQWTTSKARTVTVDDYFVDSRRRLPVIPHLAEIHRNIREIKENITAEHNKKFLDYYQDKPKKLYTEVAVLASTFII